MKITLLLIFAALGITPLVTAASAKYVSSEGQWHLDLAATHYPAGFDITSNDMNVTKDDGTILQFTETVTFAGKPLTTIFDGAYDGKPHDIGNGQTLTFRHVSAGTYGIVRHTNGAVAERTSCTISADTKTLTCRILVLPAKGKPVRFVEHFVKGE
jgi:hypothetical protein